MYYSTTKQDDCTHSLRLSPPLLACHLHPSPMAAASFTRLSSFSFPSGDRVGRRNSRVVAPIRACSSSIDGSPRLSGLRLDPKKVETLLNSMKWDEKGLVVAIAQNVDTGAILMQGFANREALVKTISSGKATFYSRSRSSLWTKGETSMNFIDVNDILIDCDRDSMIYSGKPDGPTCHTGSETCYFTSVTDLSEDGQIKEQQLASTTLSALEATISQRKAEIETSLNGKPSWTKRLLLDEELLCSKIREEAAELTQTLLNNEGRSRVISEMADVLYHCLVFLGLMGVKFEEVIEELRKRFTQSGVEEKSKRMPKKQS